MGGWLRNGADGSGFVVVRLAGATGDERWRRRIGAPVSGSAAHVAVDPAGNVLAVGTLAVLPFSERAPRRELTDLAVVKLDGRDGTLVVSGPASCPPTPAAECTIGSGDGWLWVGERSLGSERLALRWRGRPAAMPMDLGNPLLDGGTAYAVCVFDDAARLRGAYTIDRAGTQCGARPCWTRVDVREAGGYRFSEWPEPAGIRYVELLSSPERALTLTVRGRNLRGRPPSLPPGFAPALQSSTGGVTVQLFSGHADDQCISLPLPRVLRATGATYRAASAR